jgi:hypothetical protein
MFDEITWFTVIWAKDKWVLVPDCSSKYIFSSSVAVDIVDGTDDSESASNDSTIL